MFSYYLVHTVLRTPWEPKPTHSMIHCQRPTLPEDAYLGQLLVGIEMKHLFLVSVFSFPGHFLDASSSFILCFSCVSTDAASLIV